MNLKTGVSRKQSTPNFPKNEHFLPHDKHTYVCISGGKKCSFFEKFGVLCFLEAPVLRSAHFPYYRLVTNRLIQHHSFKIFNLKQGNLINKFCNSVATRQLKRAWFLHRGFLSGAIKPKNLSKLEKKSLEKHCRFKMNSKNNEEPSFRTKGNNSSGSLPPPL